MHFVSYLRVSTDRQGKSGLGLEAQRKAVADHVAGKGQIVAEYVEIESGTKNERPQLAHANDKKTILQLSGIVGTAGAASHRRGSG